MVNPVTPGALLRRAIEEESPLQVMGAIDAYAAMMAERAGFRALYLSGAGVANAALGLPDLGMTSLDTVLEETRRITGASRLPLLVDAETGWGHAFAIARTVREMTRAGAAGIHIEDQVAAKRCGHRPGKQLASPGEMVDRIKAAVDGRTDPSFVIMARTDAVAIEGLEAAVERAGRYREAGADMIFPEALADLSHYRRFVDIVGVPVLANMTEFGVTPLYTVEELRSVGVRLALYPLSAFRAMAAAGQAVFRAIRSEGTQRNVLGSMQTRAEMYDIIGYEDYERKLDALFGKEDPS
ncbi:MAG TPA: methylisocitrate lyase [Candidatus Deferrimicrobiaceae bacterium]|jgi:methylisocitrate lyase